MTDRIDRRRLFTGCVVSLVATAFGFAVRAAILGDWSADFNLSQEQIGYLLGAGLFPFAISIILFSLIIDKLGNGVSMAIAFSLHVVSAILTVAAPLALAPAGAGPEEVAAGQQLGFTLLYIGTFIFALGNGTIEAVVNPVTATLYADEKTRYLNILHAGWPGGLVLGGLFAIAVSQIGAGAVSFIDPASVPGRLWQWQVGLVLLPTFTYGLMLFRQKFPVQERVAANVPYVEMLREFGAGSCFIVCFLVIAGLNQILLVAGVPTFADNFGPSIGMLIQIGLALIPTLLFAFFVRSFGRPMFVLLLLVMFLLATAELGTDSWISNIMSTVLESPTRGPLFLVWTSFIMFVLRFFAGPIVARITPLGLLAVCAAVASVGLLWLSQAGTAALMLFVAATFYGLGKTFFWPTTLGVVSEQYPRGGALMLNAIAGVGMIAVGTLGNPGIGALQDGAFSTAIRAEDPALAERVLASRPGQFGESLALDPSARAALSAELAEAEERAQDSMTRGASPANVDATVASALAADPKVQELAGQIALITAIESRTQQATLGKIAILPAIMFFCYLGLILYFHRRGGYRAKSITEDVPVAAAPAREAASAGS